MSVSVALPRDVTKRRTHDRVRVWVRSALALAVLMVLLQSSDLLPADTFQRRLSEQASGLVFDFFTWEWKALLVKAGMGLAAPQDTLTEAQRHQLVLDYVDAQRRANAFGHEIESLYSRLDAEEAALQSAPLRNELEITRAYIAARQPMVEGILEEQISTELQAEGLGRWGFVWPPVKIHFTELPLLLVISARTAIAREQDVDLKAGLPLSEQEALEDRVDRLADDKISLVTPIGGLSAYPAMILETDSLIWLTDTFAHEWTHHFLVFRPLGLNYEKSGEMTSINETTASIVGREIGRRVITRYYPELVPHLPALPIPPDRPPMEAGDLVWPEELPADQFSFGREMRVTRLRVDELLAEGKVEEAEAYMEQRRRVFVEQGHKLRKLNQAYFAFYGSYATNPSTANPIGGQLEWLRGQSASLRDYLYSVASIDRHEELLALLPPGDPASAG